MAGYEGVDVREISDPRDLTPRAKQITDEAFDKLEAAARERGETPHVQYVDVQHAVAAALRVLDYHGAAQGDVALEILADELEGKPVPDWWKL
jgi:hypothetical protein